MIRITIPREYEVKGAKTRFVVLPGNINGVAKENIHVEFDTDDWDAIAAEFVIAGRQDLLFLLEHTEDKVIGHDGDKDLTETIKVVYTRQATRIELPVVEEQEFDSPQFPEVEDEVQINTSNPLDLISDEGNESDDLAAPLSDKDAAKIDSALGEPSFSNPVPEPEDKDAEVEAVAPHGEFKTKKKKK